MTAGSRKKGYTDDCRRRRAPAMLVTLSRRRGHAGHPTEDTRMTAARQLSERPCRSLGPRQRTAGTQMTAVAPSMRAAMLVTRSLPRPSLPQFTRPPSQWHRKGARLYSPRRYMLTAQASTRAYLALTVEDVFVFHAHAFNIALLLAVDPPTAQEAETKPGAQWEAPVQWLCQCLGVCHGASAISPSPEGGGGRPQYLRGERSAAAPAPRALTRIGFITVPRNALRGAA